MDCVKDGVFEICIFLGIFVWNIKFFRLFCVFFLICWDRLFWVLNMVRIIFLICKLGFVDCCILCIDSMSCERFLRVKNLDCSGIKIECVVIIVLIVNKFSDGG